MHRVLQTFMDRLTDSRDAEAFRKTMADAAAAFDLPVFAYLRMPRDGRAPAALISTYPVRWTDRYLERHYERLDPVIGLAHDRIEPFEWGLSTDTFEMTSAQEQLFDEAAEFGISCGFTIPIQDGHGPVAAVTFASDARRPEFLRTIERNELVLQLMALCLHSHARRKLYGDPLSDIARLTPRELDCIRWAAEGKTAWETAQILKIAERTAVWHIENAKRKLGVRTKCQIAKLLGRAMHGDNDVC